MRVISRRKLREFWEAHPDAEQPLKAWYQEAKAADWSNPAEIKRQYRSASILSNRRAVFNLAGNKYRLVVALNYHFATVYIRFVGTHRQYDRIDASEV